MIRQERGLGCFSGGRGTGHPVVLATLSHGPGNLLTSSSALKIKDWGALV